MPSRGSQVSRAETLAQRLEGRISGGSLPAGHRLGTKEQLKQHYGVAAGTLNEALRLLQIRGLVEARPGPRGGVFTAAPSPALRLSHLVLGFRADGATARDGLEVRNALEPLLIAQAARHATDADARTLQKILDRMHDELDQPAAYLKTNWNLHRHFAAMGRNVILSRFYVAVLDYAEAHLDMVWSDDSFGTGVDNWRIHEQLVKAVIAGDLKRAAAAARRHQPLTDWQTSG
jgi:DNA-binding FadR family transcriptional regulator